jgi:hypothetical protein
MVRAGEKHQIPHPLPHSPVSRGMRSQYGVGVNHGAGPSRRCCGASTDVVVAIRLEEKGSAAEPVQQEEMAPPCGLR